MKLVTPLFLASLVGALSFFIGAMYPRKRINLNSSLFQPRKWEGDFFKFIKVSKWKDHVPDMSKIFTLIIRKQINRSKDVSKVSRLIKETCIAEVVHVDLAVIGMLSSHYATTEYGALIWFLFTIGNIPFILIQRYNRPRLVKLEKNLKKRHAS